MAMAQSYPRRWHHTTLTEDMEALAFDDRTASQLDEVKAAANRARAAQAETPWQLRADARTASVRATTVAQATERADRVARLKALRQAQEAARGQT